MTKIEENEWLLNVLTDLKNNYLHHNKNELDYIIQLIKYRIESLSESYNKKDTL